MRKVIIAIVLMLAVALVIFSMSELQGILDTLRHSDLHFLAAAILVEMIWMYNSATTYSVMFRLLGTDIPPEIAFVLESIGKIEKSHQERYVKLLAEVEAHTFFAKEEKGRWRCRNCGHIHEGNEAPTACPVCKHPQAYFELVEDHY